MLRKDFIDIYLTLKKKGLLLSIFTNATLITDEHARLFKMYPPRDLEVTVYGTTKETYEEVTRKPGSFASFIRGIDILSRSGSEVHFKAMALRSNAHEMPEIARFCKERTKDYFRFDPFLHLRYDRNPQRNEEVKAERLSPEEIVALEKSDPERMESLEKRCNTLIMPEFSDAHCNHLFHCGAGNRHFVVSYKGLFRLCSSLWHPECVYNLRENGASLTDALRKFVPHVREMRSDSKYFLDRCKVCPIINLCMWCPANAYLETGELDGMVEYFCEVAHARKNVLKSLTKENHICNMI